MRRERNQHLRRYGAHAHDKRSRQELRWIGGARDSEQSESSGAQHPANQAPIFDEIREWTNRETIGERLHIIGRHHQTRTFDQSAF
jgi:hypothetical protein